MAAATAIPSSDLNPYAPIFIPAAYRVVEDFSDEWWDLVQSSPWFRDYWLRECFQDPQSDDGDLFLLPDLDPLFDANHRQQLNNQEQERRDRRNRGLDLIPLGTLKWGSCKHRGAMNRTRNSSDKAPKIVTVKPSPRTIHQPR